MKAAAISLLASLYRTPSLILLEEIENGVNPGNIQELMRWIWQMTSPTSEGFTSQLFKLYLWVNISSKNKAYSSKTSAQYLPN
jgi:hypothetical protein